MRIDIISVLPELMASPFETSILKRAVEKGVAEVYFHQLRDWSIGKHKQIDDEPYGGGAGMVMMVEPLDKCISELKEARRDLSVLLSKHIPEVKFERSVRLVTKWCFPITGKHTDGEYKYTRPDTDNLQKLLKDCMTDTGYWKDDALVVCEITEKFWAAVPGIYIKIEEV